MGAHRRVGCEQTTLRAWLPTVLVLAGPAIALMVAVPAQRVYSIPLVSPGFSPNHFARPRTAAEEATLTLYQEAGRRLIHLRYEEAGKLTTREAIEADSQARVAEYVAVNEESSTLALALEASRQTACSLYHPTSHPATSVMGSLGDLIVVSGHMLEAEGQLDEALERYLAALRISVHMHNRANMNILDRARTRLEREVHRSVSVWASQKPEIQANRRRHQEGGGDSRGCPLAIRVGQIAIYATTTSDRGRMGRRLRRRPARGTRHSSCFFGSDVCPRERARAYRLLTFLTATHIDEIRQLESAVAQGERIARRPTTIEAITNMARGSTCSRSGSGAS